MLDQTTRAAILRLRKEGHGSRAIATALGISRNAVREVLRAGTAEVPRLERPELGEPHRDDIVALYVDCKGNLVRVHEKLHDTGATLSYQALTAFSSSYSSAWRRGLPATATLAPVALPAAAAFTAPLAEALVDLSTDFSYTAVPGAVLVYEEGP